MNMLKDMSADAELRINAYLAVMECPDVENIAAISDVLEVRIIKQNLLRRCYSNLCYMDKPLLIAVLNHIYKS